MKNESIAGNGRVLPHISRSRHLAVRLILSLIAVTASLFAQPDLTRVVDTVFLADGSRFDGYMQFEWQSFVTSKAPVAPESKLVRVVNGALDVTLAATQDMGYTAFYRVRYFSSGRVRYTEYWDVPKSTTPQNVAGVRMSGIPSGGSGNGGGTGGDGGGGIFALPIGQEDVIDLPGDLEDRPVKGPNFFPSRAVFVNPEGALEAISGSPTDCVRVNGTSVPCGSNSTYVVDGEPLQGQLTGINTVFTITGTPLPPESLQVFRNGVLQRVGLDYALSGSTIQFVLAAVPQPNDILVAYYRTAETTGSPSTGVGLLPQVLCSKAGLRTTSLSFASLGACTLGGGLLFPGDRLEIQMDWKQDGVAAGAFDVELLWGGTPFYTRSFQTSDTTAAGTVRVSIGTSARQFTAQSFGSVSALTTATGTLNLPPSAFQFSVRGRVADAVNGALLLTNFSVIRYPGVSGD